MTPDTLPHQPEEAPPPGRTWVMVLATAYCPCERCCGAYAIDPTTSIGFDIATHPYGIAADHSLLPPHTVLEVPGYGTVPVDDTGAAMRRSGQEGVVQIDLRYRTHDEALQWGRRWLWIAVPSHLPATALPPPPEARSMPFPFVIGSVRSGTTMMRLMLNRHPQLAIPPETYFPVELWPYRHRYVRTGCRFDMQLFTEDLLFNPHFPDFRRDWGLDPEFVKEELPRRPANDYADAIRRVYELYAEQHGKPRYGNKTPWFVRKVDLLSVLFPEAVFVHLIRDGREVVMSMLDQHWGPSRLTDATALWKRLVIEGRSAGNRLGPDRYIEVRYQDLIDDPRSTLQRLCGRVGLKFDSEMLRYHEDALAHMPARVRHLNGSLTQPPVAGMRDWRNGMRRTDLATFETIAGDLLEDLGYETVFTEHPASARARAFFGAGISRGEATKRQLILYGKKFRSRVRGTLRRMGIGSVQ